MKTDYKTGGKAMKAIIIAFTVLTLALCCLSITGCGYCAHELKVKDEKVASTCVEHGHSYTYECKKCKKLFAYTLDKGLYEVSEAEELPLSAEHTLPEVDEEHPENFPLGIRLKEGKTAAESVLDYEITTKCTLCQKEFAIEDKNLAAVVPLENKVSENTNTRRTYSGVRMQDEATGRWYTDIQFYKATRPTDVTELKPFAKITEGGDLGWVSSDGAYQRLPLYVPFNKNQTRHVVYIVHNSDAAATVNLEWSIDGKRYATVTVAPGEYKPLVVYGLKDWDCNVDSQFFRVSTAAGGATLGSNIKMEMTGFLYTSGTVDKLDIDSQPTKTEYKVGETFDSAGLRIYATYSDYCLGKTVNLAECKFSTDDRTLTEKDDRVTISYGGKKVSVPITVVKEDA